MKHCFKFTFADDYLFKKSVIYIKFKTLDCHSRF